MSRPPYLPSDPNETDNISRYAPAYKPGDVRALGAAPGLNSYKVGSAESIARRVQAEGRRAMMQDPRVQQYMATRPWDIASVMQTGMTNAGLANAAQASARSDAMYKSGLELRNALAKETGYADRSSALDFLRRRGELDAQSKRLGAASSALTLQRDTDAYNASLRLRDTIAGAAPLADEAAALQTLARAGHAIDPKMLADAQAAVASRRHALGMVDHSATASARAAGVAPGSKTEGFYAERETAKREADAAKVAREAQALREAQSAEASRKDDLYRGAPITSPDGKFFWNGKGWATVASKEDVLAEAIRNRNSQPGTPAAPAANQFEAGKVYVQNGKRYTTTDGKTFSEVK